MAVEAARGCGYRQVGGIYLVGSGVGLACDRLPIELCVCPTCGTGIKQSRGWTWVDIPTLIGGDHTEISSDEQEARAYMKSTGLPYTSIPAKTNCRCPEYCPLCHNVKKMGRGGLLWIGTQFYPTIEAFEAEAKVLGISRRVHSIPRGFKMGETWLLFAHARGIVKPVDGLQAKYVPAIFRVWKPERIEKIYNESQRGSEEVAADEKRGITPVFVPDNDKDHHNKRKRAEQEEEGETPGVIEDDCGPLFQPGDDCQ